MHHLTLVSDRARVRVLDPAGELRYLVDGPTADTLLKTGAFRAVSRKHRLRALIAQEDAAAAAILDDLDGLVHDNGPVLRPGEAHRLNTWDNPPGVLTISRIPKSLRPVFTAVVDSVAA